MAASIAKKRNPTLFVCLPLCACMAEDEHHVQEDGEKCHERLVPHKAKQVLWVKPEMVYTVVIALWLSAQAAGASSVFEGLLLLKPDLRVAKGSSVHAS